MQSNATQRDKENITEPILSRPNISMGSARDANRSEGKRKIVAGPLCKSVKAGKNCPRWARPGPFSLVLLHLKTADDARPHLVLRPLSCPAVISVCYAGPAGRHICGGAAGATWIWSGVGRGDTTPARLKPLLFTLPVSIRLCLPPRRCSVSVRCRCVGRAWSGISCTSYPPYEVYVARVPYVL